MVRSENKVSAKRRSSPAKRKPRSREATSSQSRSGSRQSHRRYDIVGIGFFTLATLCVVALMSSNSGVVGGFMRDAFGMLFGRGAWVMPIAFAILGYTYLRGHSKSGSWVPALGVTFLVCAVLGGFARATGADYFDPKQIALGGGYVGAAVASLFSSMFGEIGKFVACLATGLIGTVLCLDKPLRALYTDFRDRAALPLYEAEDSVPQKAARTGKAVIGIPDEEDQRNRSLPKGFVDEPAADVPVKRAAIIRDHTDTPRPEKAKPEFSIESTTPKEGYQLPSISALNEPAEKPKRTASEMQQNIETIEGTLEHFGIDANVVEVATGPTITRYEIQLGAGIRVARIVSLADNIAMDMAATMVRVEAPIPGKAAIGLEIPNATSSMVNLRELVESKEFMDHPSRLCVALGKDVAGVNRYADLTKMPHLLIAGATNSGKSIGLATLITSRLMRNTPKDLRLVRIDPKRVELTLFDQIPHLLCPVIKDVKEAPGVLMAVRAEMDRRYDLLSEKGVRNIDGWNAKASYADKLPYIVVIIDELADLMIQAKQDVEGSIVRLAQLARAVGIHLVIATQRPSVDVITGTIKANIPSRIAFSVASQIDSRTILDSKGAEALIGRGDMLYMPIDATKPMRVQGCYVAESEIEAICKHWREQEAPNYAFDPAEFEASDPVKAAGDFGGEVDPMWEEVVRYSVETGQVSTSMIQRKFRLGFQRASRLLDEMEGRGIIAAKDGPRPREVLLALADLESVFGGASAAPKYEMGTSIDDWEEA